MQGINFSDQAALNLVLEDDAKAVFNEAFEIGLGAQDTSHKSMIHDGRVLAMLFGSKFQNLTMYKSNNTGKDIQHEIRDLTTSSELINDEDDNWIEDIAIDAPNLKLERYNCNDTHLAATNWLIKTKANHELRFQGVYLFDRTTGYRKDLTTQTGILNQPVVEEETSACKFRRELNTELQYTQNESNLYINNILRTSFNWNESFVSTILNDTKRQQDVILHKSNVSDDFSLIKNLAKGKSLNVNASLRFRHLPNSLLTVENNNYQKLDVNSISSLISTGFRHRLLGIYISYDAQMSFDQDDITLNTREKVQYQKAELKVTPRINYEKDGFRTSFSLPLYSDSYRLAENKKSIFFANPYLSLGYKISGTMDVSLFYNHQKICYETSKNAPLMYFVSYTDKMNGDGKLNFVSQDGINGKFDYSNANIGVFFYLKGSYTKLRNTPMYSYSYENNIYTTQATDKKSANEQFFTSIEASKSLGYGKFSITFGMDYLQNNYNTWISDEVTNCHLKNASGHIQFAFMPSPLFSVEEKSTYNSIKTTNSTYPELSTLASKSFEHEMTLYLMPGNWNFSLTNNLYHSNDKRINTAYFADFKCAYSKKIYELSFIVSNIFGSKEYERNTITNTNMLFTINRLRPREFLVKIAFSL